MPKGSAHHSSSIVKLLFIGDSGTGKTSSLLSLVQADYQLRILDCDNGLDSLINLVKHHCPDKIDNIEYETKRDKYKASAGGPVIAGQPKAFVECLGLLNKWSDGTEPSAWGPSHIMVVDTLTGLSGAAFEWAKGMSPGAKDPRQWYFAAQQAIEKVIDLLTGELFHCNVIVISHIMYKEREDGSTKGYATSVGSALGPTIPKYFNNLLMAETVGGGKNARRTIRTLPTGIVDLKTSAPFALTGDLPLDTGLATIFETLKKGGK